MAICSAGLCACVLPGVFSKGFNVSVIVELCPFEVQRRAQKQQLPARRKQQRIATLAGVVRALSALSVRAFSCECRECVGSQQQEQTACRLSRVPRACDLHLIIRTVEYGKVGSEKTAGE